MAAFTADVSIDRGASVEEADAVRAVFTDLNIEARVRLGIVQLSEIPPWVVMVGIPLGLFMKAFVEAAGKDAWAGVKGFVQRVYQARSQSKQPKGTLRLEDTETRLLIILTDDLPDEAFEKLINLDLSQFRNGPLYWDGERGRWFSTMDEMRERRRRKESPDV